MHSALGDGGEKPLAKGIANDLALLGHTAI